MSRAGSVRMIPFAKRRPRPKVESQGVIEVTFDDIEIVRLRPPLPTRAPPLPPAPGYLPGSPWSIASRTAPPVLPNTVTRASQRRRRSLIPYAACLVWLGIFAGLTRDLVARGEGASFVEAVASFVDDRPMAMPGQGLAAAAPITCAPSP